MSTTEHSAAAAPLTGPAGPRSDRSRVRRVPRRAAYDDDAIHTILDAGLIGHVGFVASGRPIVIPMLYGRDGDSLYLHGSVASRLLRSENRSESTYYELSHDALVEPIFASRRTKARVMGLIPGIWGGRWNPGGGRMPMILAPPGSASQRIETYR